jgi:hypothetical protein
MSQRARVALFLKVLQLVSDAVPVVCIIEWFFRSTNACIEGVLNQFCVDGDELDLISGQIFFSENCVGWTFWDADCTVYTLIGVDD